MLRPFDLLEHILIDIEKGIKKGINSNILAEKYELSERHLRRMFQFAFKQPLCGYIRSRKLAVSLEDLLKSDKNILDIALDFGFGYEQSYIRAFKHEYGITPGDLRKSGQVVKVRPPIHLFDENKIADSVLFGPDIVMVPQFHVVGKVHQIFRNESLILAPKAAIHFWENDCPKIKRGVNPNVYFGITKSINSKDLSSGYLTSIQVENCNCTPPGFTSYTFETSLCARFRYIGQHHYYELNRTVAAAMYEAIWKFANDEYISSKRSKYALLVDKVYFEKIDIRLYDGNYCQMEWFCPVVEKRKLSGTVSRN